MGNTKQSELRQEINRLRGQIQTKQRRAIIRAVDKNGDIVGNFYTNGEPVPDDVTEEPLFTMLHSFFELFQSDKRFIVAYSGRASGKSWAFAQYLLACAYERQTRNLFLREKMNSILESQLALLRSMIIADPRLSDAFDVLQCKIVGVNGSEFIFKGLQSFTASSIKSFEGFDTAFVEEAQSLTARSLTLLLPTIRKKGSKIYFALNKENKDDPVTVDFIDTERVDTEARKFNYLENPYNSEETLSLAEFDKINRPTMYQHIWQGEFLILSALQIFKDCYTVWDFTFKDVLKKERDLIDPFKETSYGIKKKIKILGAVDFGFRDPNAALLAFVSPDEKRLYVYWEYYKTGQTARELGEELLKQEDIACRAPLRGDSARPETIRQLELMGINIKPVRKGPNSILEGISRIQSLEVYVHPCCKNLLSELSLYSWKQNKRTGEISQIPEDKSNHLCDCLRYLTSDLSPLRKRGEYKELDVKWG